MTKAALGEQGNLVCGEKLRPVEAGVERLNLQFAGLTVRAHAATLIP